MVRTVLQFAAVAAALALAFKALLWACPMSDPAIVTTFARHPDLPRKQYVAGNLGVVLPSYAVSYQVIAYRHMMGIGMNAGEQSQANLYYLDKQTWQEQDPTAVDWLEEWQKLSGKPREEQHRFNADDANYELNCADDAFRVAVFTARDRRKRGFYEHWLASQKAVFSNCAGIKGDALPALPANAPKWLAQDHAYQSAARLFYRGEREGALRAFREIAADATSQWRTLARYLVVRTLTRNVQDDPAHLQAAIAEVQAVLADAQLASIHGPVRALRRRILVTASPEEALRELTDALTHKGMDLSLRQDLWDFVHLRDRIALSKPAKPLLQTTALSRWLEIFRNPNAENLALARAEWHKTRRLPWLAAAISATVARDAGAEQLLEDAVAVPQNHPAYITITYHRARLLCELRRYDEAFALADAHWQNPNLGTSSRNLFGMLRSRSASDLTTFLRSLPRVPAMTPESWRGDETWNSEMYLNLNKRKVIGYSEAQALNFDTPLSDLVELALAEPLPDELSTRLKSVALMRALILERSEFYRPLAQALAASVPAYAKPLQAALAAEPLRDELLHFTATRGEFTANLTNGSGLIYQQASGVVRQVSYWRAHGRYLPAYWQTDMGWMNCVDSADSRVPIATRVFESKAQVAKAEKAQVDKAGAANEFYANYALAYYKAHPTDPRNAALLGQVVRIQNFVGGSESGNESVYAVWRILQRKYPTSSWATRFKAGAVPAHGSIEPIDAPRDPNRNMFPGVGCSADLDYR